MIADEVETLSSSVLGLTVGCARCHNHKYDPIPQRDYYRLSAILMAAYDPYDWLIPASGNPYKLKYGTRHIDLALDTERQEVERFNAPLEAEQKRLENALEKASQPFREKLLQERLEALPQGVREDLQKVAGTAEEKRTDVQKYLADKFEDTLKIKTEDLIKKYAEFKPEGERLRKAISELTLDKLILKEALEGKY